MSSNGIRMIIVMAGIVLMLLAAIASAQMVEINHIDDSMLSVGSTLEIANKTYTVTENENVYVYSEGFSARYKRVFVQDAELIESLEDEIEILEQNISSKQAMLDDLYETLERAGDINENRIEKIRGLELEIEWLNNQSDAIQQELDILLAEESRMQSTITGNILLSQWQSSSMIVVLLVLVIIVVGLEIKAYFFSSDEEDEDSEENNEQGN